MLKKFVSLVTLSFVLNACGSSQSAANVARTSELTPDQLVFSCLKGKTVLALVRSAEGNGLLVQTGPYQTDDITTLLAKQVKAAERNDRDGSIEYRFDLGQGDGVVVLIAPHAENSKFIFNRKVMSCSEVVFLDLSGLDAAVSATAK